MSVTSAEGGFRAPGPGPAARDPSLVAQFRLSLRNPIEAWPRAVYEERKYRPPVPGMPILLMDPDLIRAVLVDDPEAFPQGGLFRRLLSPIWGKGLATAEGAEWRWQRRASAPPFRPAGLAALAPRMRHAAETALLRWSASGGDPIDMAEEAAQITFDIIVDTMLSGGEDFDRSTARSRIAAFMAEQSGMRVSYFLAPDSYHDRRIMPETEMARQLRADVGRMISRRRQVPPRGDLVDLLMAAKDPESDRAMDDAILRDNLLGFIVAGHETSAASLAWALYLLSQQPSSADRIRCEVAEVTNGSPIEAEHVDRLVFTRRVVQEALRLYPPAHSLTRICARKVEVAGQTLRAGSRIVIPVYALHRHRLWWTDPDVFDPDRFAPGKPQPDRHVYMPFGAGPRVCIGAAFAMTELVVALATLVRHASFELVAGHRVWPAAELALRPLGGLPMRVDVVSQDRIAA